VSDDLFTYLGDLSGPEYDFLGHLRNPTFLQRGHNFAFMPGQQSPELGFSDSEMHPVPPIPAPAVGGLSPQK
jgi:hypothetical protein